MKIKIALQTILQPVLTDGQVILQITLMPLFRYLNINLYSRTLPCRYHSILLMVH